MPKQPSMSLVLSIFLFVPSCFLHELVKIIFQRNDLSWQKHDICRPCRITNPLSLCHLFHLSDNTLAILTGHVVLLFQPRCHVFDPLHTRRTHTGLITRRWIALLFGRWLDNRNIFRSFSLDDNGRLCFGILSSRRAWWLCFHEASSCCCSFG